MAYLIDTCVLVRLANRCDAASARAFFAINELHRQSENLCIAPQVLIEFRGVATRPTALNGLSLRSDEVVKIAGEFEAKFSLLPETPEIFPAWKRLVDDLGVVGKQVHDARLASICHVHGITQFLTFNVQHFARFANAGPGFVVVHPANLPSP